jgi:demethylspheroidene O-methyltransferase
MSTDTNSLSLFTRWVLRRNAVLGSARFQRWAARTPIMRIVARRRAAAQFDLVAGFVYTQVLAACVELGLIDFLSGALRTVADIAEDTGLSESATERLLKAAAALTITETPQPGLWTLGEAGAPLVANPGALAMIRHHGLLYRDLADPVALLRQDRQAETALSAFWTYAAKDQATPDASVDYSALMAATQPMVSAEILAAYPFDRHQRMLDIGGGSGGFALAVGQAAPNLMLGIFDLPPVIAEAEKQLAAAPIAERLTLHAGSFARDPLPDGYDLMTLVRIVHDHDDAVIRPLFAAIHAALPPGGCLLIIEPMAATPSAPHMGDAYFGLYLWAMGSGESRTAGRLRAMLAEAGFARVSAVATALPIITSALAATKA